MLKLMIPNRMRANVEGRNTTRDNLSEGRVCLHLFRVGAQRKRVDAWRKENVDSIVVTSCPPRSHVGMSLPSCRVVHTHDGQKTAPN